MLEDHWLLLFSSKILGSLIGHETDDYDNTFKMEMGEEKDSEKLWNKEIFVNEKWEIEGMIFGQGYPTPYALQISKYGTQKMGYLENRLLFPGNFLAEIF